MGSLATDGIHTWENDGFDIEAKNFSTTNNISLESFEPSNFSSKFAVTLQSACKKYGKSIVLDKFNMNVEEGTIYSLLGASGCGKTTALSCVIGITGLDSGKVLIFGSKPGSVSSGVPGKRLGYMPQEIALNREFTMDEVLQYFGRIYGMTYHQVEDRRKFFMEFLNLQTINTKQLHQLSEGQRRRVSFAVALVHQPEILILDEPTVGADPLLRERMWQHLSDLTTGKQTTVIITTHYIEETKAADMIGLMRHGHLLVEESPTTLLENFQTNSMEEIVFQLCLKDTSDEDNPDEKRQRDSIINQLNTSESISAQNGSAFAPVKSQREILWRQSSTKWKEGLKTHSLDRVYALFRKNLLVAYRSIWFWLFLLLMPAVNIYLICVCLVSKPRDLKFGIVNHEVPTSPCVDQGDICFIANLSCRYIRELGNSTVIPLSYDSEEAALEQVINGNTYGYLSIPQNFSDNLFNRFGGTEMDEPNINDTIAGSQIRMRLDMSNTLVGLQLKYFFFETFQTFSHSLLSSCGINPEVQEIPLVFDTPIYGKADEDTNTFIVPGAAITFLSFLASLTCGLAFIIEKNDGMLTRVRAAGVTHVEIMLSHLSIHFVVLLIQSAFAFLVMFLIFDIPQLGSNVLGFSIVILNGVTGMSLGFIAASVCDKERNAMLIAIGAILPTLMVSGTLSPFEALPPIVKYVGYIYPGTLPAFALKAILLKGWGLSNFTVWIGFLTAFIWITIYWVVIFMFHSFHK